MRDMTKLRLFISLTVAFSSTFFYFKPASAKDIEDIARVAKAITVRIEGATQGSGVLVEKNNDTYTILTAWHVVRSTRYGEELGIYTSDGKQYQLDQGSIQRLGQVDMAILTFNSSSSYQVAPIGNTKSVSMGTPIFVSGFPLPTTSVPSGVMRFVKGDVIANATVQIPNGYQLLYSNPTLPGMSGGSVLNTRGELVGIHGKSERDDQVSMSTGKAVSTGTNQAVPISYYRQFNTGQPVVADNTQAMSADDYLAQANQLQEEGREIELIRVANQALSIQPSTLGYFYRGNAKGDLKDYQGAIADYSKAIAIDPQYAGAYNNRGNAKGDLKDYQGAIADYNKAIAINPQDADAYDNRGNTKGDLKDYRGAIADYSKAIAINPQHPKAYINRGNAKHELRDYQGAIADYSEAIEINSQFADVAYHNRGRTKYELTDYRGAIADYSKAIAINPQDADAYKNRGAAKYELTDYQGGCADYKKALSLGDQETAQWLQSEGGAWCPNME